MAAADPPSFVAGSMHEGSSDDTDGLGDEGGTNGVAIFGNTSATAEQSDHRVLQRGIESSRTDPM
jgi:hypothetical protein